MKSKSMYELISELKDNVWRADIAQETISWGGRCDYTITSKIIEVKRICEEILELDNTSKKIVTMSKFIEITNRIIAEHFKDKNNLLGVWCDSLADKFTISIKYNGEDSKYMGIRYDFNKFDDEELLENEFKCVVEEYLNK